MKFLLLLPLLFLSVNEAFAETTCVPHCIRRSVNKRCLQYGPDYCDQGPGVACIPQCVQRSIQARCLNWGMDFCGVYPSCAIRCAEHSTTGMCLRYDPDACFSEYP